jgi:hypothetical protein
MSHPPMKLGINLLAALAMALGACSDSSGPSGSTLNTLSQVQASDLGQDVAEEVDELADVSSFNMTTGVNFQAAAYTGPHGFSVPPAPCVTITPVPLVNSDGDIVPDSARFDYGGCVFTRAAGQIIDSLSGTIDYLDPQPTVVTFGVRHVFTNFALKRVNTPFPLRSFIAVKNGTREWGASPDTLGHTITNFVTQVSHESGRVTTHTRDWVGRFVATTPGTIGLGLPLPAGAWTVAGTGSWATANRTWSVTISTPTALAYDPTCTVSPRFTAGRVLLVVTRNAEVTNVQIDFTGCGQYLVTRTVIGAT